MNEINSIRSPQKGRHLWQAINLNTPRALLFARIFLPICFGLYSLLLGADANWDLLNYHLYNPFAWLNDKLLLDIAPAGLQSYFNPLLDLIFYWANAHFPPQLVGFIMGCLHGLVFNLLLAIAPQVLPDLSERDRYRAPLLLALAGCFTASYLSGLGNSMGDDSTALFSLLGLYIILSNWDRFAKRSAPIAMIVIASGVIIGLGSGLKLTTAAYALALYLTLWSYPGDVFIKFRLSSWLSLGMVVGLLLTGGYWFFHIWKLFGNPLYPQFSKIFPNPLIEKNVTVDIRYGPRNIFEHLFWPFIFTWNAKRVSEAAIHQAIWPVFYSLLIIYSLKKCLRVANSKSEKPLDPRAQFLIRYIIISFVVWMEVFSIYRYIVAIEVLVPIAIFILLHQLLPAIYASRVATWALLYATLIVAMAGAPTWGHEGWSDPLYHAEVPIITQPDRTTVVIASTRTQAWAWLATQFSPKVAFMQVDSGFPGSNLFREHMLQTARARNGPIFAIIDGRDTDEFETIEKNHRFLDSIGITKSTLGCSLLQRAIISLNIRAQVTTSNHSNMQCGLELNEEFIRAIAEKDKAHFELSVSILRQYGFNLDRSSCEEYPAGVGTGKKFYQWCRLSTSIGSHF